MPNQLLQLLRPFLVVTEDFDKKFAATFAIPEFRTLASGYTSAVSKVLGYLTTLADVTEETASRILANEMLLGRVRDLAIDTPEFKRTIDSELVRDNEHLLKENEKLLASMTEAEREKIDVANELSQQQRLVAQHERLVREQRALVEATENDLRKREQQLQLEKAARIQKETEASDLERKIEDTEARRLESEAALKQLSERHSSLASKVRASVAVGILLIGWLFLAYIQANWPWLHGHTHRLGIILCGALVVAGLSWSVADTKPSRRSTIIVAVVIASIVTLIQIIDSEPRTTKEASPKPTARP